MSKMDGLRAMREARYARDQARGATPTSATRKWPAAKAEEAEKQAAGVPQPADEALCGHRNMSGRTCTREQGHAAKSHRYS